MATGGYNASFDETPTGFGSDSAPAEEAQAAGNGKGRLDSAPLVGIDYKRNEDLKNMLDGNKDHLKLEAMKIIIGMVAKGRDCTNLFPAVVKNVVSKNPEIKKLVYVYLVRYAEEQQDLALLSISTFQKALKDPNQLIRASALRVLSSIRVPIIAPIMMLSIKESVTDMSPYVRKTAAHAIPKLYSLDPDLKDQLVEIIEKLLKDQTTLVAGSVVMAFEIVCPDRIDLIHKNYRKLCNLMVDVDEWGQVTILNMLTRYARTQFVCPNQEMIEEEKFYESSDESDDEDEEEEDSDDEDSDEKQRKKKKKKPKKKPYSMDPDHRLLLRVSKPLLQSRNAAVVMAVAQLYHHIAPMNEVSIIARPLIRLLKSHYEVQSVVLSNIATLSAERPGMFEPHLKSFFVHSNDPTHVRLLKLDILANIAGEASIHTILREFRAYIGSSDKQFAAATIQAIGRVSCNISDVTETCLHGLMSLLSHQNEAVVAESVVVIKKLLQMQPKENKDLIVQVARLADRVQVPSAKASILWLVGEYCTLVPKIGPDVLRKCAKTFISEDDMVKLQIVNLAAKLYVTNPKQSKLLCQYVLNMAKYDQNYDIRDRARFLRQLIMPADEEESALSKYSRKILMSAKPVPVLESNFKSRARWQLGSLSHYINTEAIGYIPLSDFPKEPPDSSVRDVKDDSFFGRTKAGSTDKKKTNFFDTGSSDDFYSSISGSDESSSESGSESDTEGSSLEESSEESEEESSSYSEEDSSSGEDALMGLRKRYIKGKPEEEEEEEEETSSEEESSEEEDSESDSEESSEDSPPPPKAKSKGKTKPSAAKVVTPSKGKAQVDEPSLLDLNDWDAVPEAPSADVPVPVAAGMLQPLTAKMSDLALESSTATGPSITPTLPLCVPDEATELLNRVSGAGLAVKYRFLRKPYITAPQMIAVELTFQNTTSSAMSSISVGSSQLQSGMKMHSSVFISQLMAGASMNFTIGIDFNDTFQPAKFEVCTGDGRKYPVKVAPVIGELVQAADTTEQSFRALQDKLTGMHESSGRVTTQASASAISQALVQAMNIKPLPTSDDSCLRFASVTFSSKLPALVTLQLKDTTAVITVNCEKMVFGSMLVKTTKETISNL